MTSDDTLGAKVLDATDCLQVGFYIKVRGTQNPATLQGLVSSSLDRVAIKKDPVFVIVQTQVTMAVTGQVKNFENAISDVQRFAACQPQEYGLISAAGVSNTGSGLLVIKDVVVPAIVIISEGEELLGRFDKGP